MLGLLSSKNKKWLNYLIYNFLIYTIKRNSIPVRNGSGRVNCRVSTLPAGMEVLAVFRASKRHLRPLAQPAHAFARIRCLALSVLGALDPDGHRPTGYSRGCPAGRALRQYVGGPCR